jgi:hypothetical protein
MKETTVSGCERGHGQGIPGCLEIMASVMREKTGQYGWVLTGIRIFRSTYGALWRISHGFDRPKVRQKRAISRSR